MSVAKLCDWISSTPPSQLLQTVNWIIPVVQSIHILAIAVVMSSVLLINLRVVGILGHGERLSVFTHRYLPWVWVALAVLLISGTTLIVGEPRRELLNSIFWIKMSLLVGVVLITLTIQHSVGTLAWIALGFWVGIIFCGRWIAYTYEP
jgi:hypothetical protein